MKNELSDLSSDEEEDNLKKKKTVKASNSKLSDDDQEEETDAEKKKRKSYEKLCKVVLDIANLLAKWGYNYNSDNLSQEGHSPITLAASCKNIPMLMWLLDKKVDIKNTIHKPSKRNFLHWICHDVIFIKDKKFNYKELIEKVQKIYVKDLKNMT